MIIIIFVMLNNFAYIILCMYIQMFDIQPFSIGIKASKLVSRWNINAQDQPLIFSHLVQEANKIWYLGDSSDLSFNHFG